MIKRHVQHLIDGHLLLMRPGQQMGDMLNLRPHHLCTEETSGALFAVDVQDTFVT
ncbi:hypothetical protein D3C73_1164070 [compost metagenome]